LAIHFGRLLGEEEWTAMVGVLDLVDGKMAKEQVRIIEEVWHDLEHHQERMGVQGKGLYKIQAISFNNTSDNQGAKKGIHVKLDRRQRESTHKIRKECELLIEKGCGDHIAVLCVWEWE
jgi:hypothetical protein